jgi:hypothetical protein
MIGVRFRRRKLGRCVGVKKTLTFIYARPETIQNPLGAAEVDEALERIAAELDLDPELEMRPQNGTAIVIPDVAPHETWAAIDRLLPIWKQARLFFLPRLNLSRCDC